MWGSNLMAQMGILITNTRFRVNSRRSFNSTTTYVRICCFVSCEVNRLSSGSSLCPSVLGCLGLTRLRTNTYWKNCANVGRRSLAVNRDRDSPNGRKLEPHQLTEKKNLSSSWLICGIVCNLNCAGSKPSEQPRLVCVPSDTVLHTKALFAPRQWTKMAGPDTGMAMLETQNPIRK